jgi:aldehyde dehydrogenase (NAD+)
MLVPEARKDDAYAIAKDAAEKVVVGDPKKDGTTIGPLVSDVQYEKVQNLIQKGIDEGAKLLIGGTGKPQGLEKGYYAKPTIFADVENDMTISKEEIFGPVLSMITYENIDDAVAIANDTEYGLAAYVSGENKETLTSIARRLRAGQIHINYGSAGPDAPFGGFKQSGNGREKAEWGLEEFLEVKAIMGT